MMVVNITIPSISTISFRINYRQFCFYSCNVLDNMVILDSQLCSFMPYTTRVVSQGALVKEYVFFQSSLTVLGMGLECVGYTLLSVCEVYVCGVRYGYVLELAPCLHMNRS